MQISIIVLVLLCTVSPSFTAPTSKPDAEESNIEEALKNFQSRLLPLNEEFKNIVKTVTKEIKTGLTSQKRELFADKEKREQVEKEIKEDDFISLVAPKVASKLSPNDPLAKLESLVNATAYYVAGKLNASDDRVYVFKNKLLGIIVKLPPLSNEFKNIVETVDKEIENLSKKQDEEKQEEKEKEKEDDLISRVAKIVSRKLSAGDPAAKIDGLVNATAYYLIEKTNISGYRVYDFKNKLLGYVLKILNERAMGASKPAGPIGVDQSKVFQALRELLEAPLISGFVTTEQEEVMIKSAVAALSKDFGMSRMTAEDLVHNMIEHLHDDIKNSSHSEEKNKTGKPLTDEEKVLGLEKMVEDKVRENDLNLDEMKYLVKSFAAAIGARNKLSEEKTKHLEEKIYKGVYDSLVKDEKDESNPPDISQLLNSKEVPEGFRTAKEDKNKRSFEFKDDDDDDDSEGDNDGYLFAMLGHLEGKWQKEKRLHGGNSSAEINKQKQRIKDILSNSLSFMESLQDERKQEHVETQHTVAPEKKPSEVEKTEPTEHHTNKPTKPAEPTKETKNKLTDKHEEKETLQKKNVTSPDSKQPVEKSGLTDDMEKEIEKAEAEIQHELEIQQQKEQEKMTELEEKKQETKDKKNETAKMDKEIEEAEKEIEKDLKQQEKESKEQAKESKEQAKESKEQAKEQAKETEQQAIEQAKEIEEQAKQQANETEEQAKEKQEEKSEKDKEIEEAEKEIKKELEDQGKDIKNGLKKQKEISKKDKEIQEAEKEIEKELEDQGKELEEQGKEIKEQAKGQVKEEAKEEQKEKAKISKEVEQAEKEIEKELQEQADEGKKTKKSMISNVIQAAEKVIAKQFKDGAKSIQSRLKKPKNTPGKNNTESNEFIKQLDDLFKDTNN